jgi:hypothetical protein
VLRIKRQSVLSAKTRPRSPRPGIGLAGRRADCWEMATTWSFALDGPDASEVIAEATREAERLGRRVVGEPTLSEVPDAEGRPTWWLSIYIERATVAS